MRLANVTTMELAAILNERLPAMNPEERLRVFAVVTQDSCRACGDAVDDVCHCENDE